MADDGVLASKLDEEDDDADDVLGVLEVLDAVGFDAAGVDDAAAVVAVDVAKDSSANGSFMSSRTSSSVNAGSSEVAVVASSMLSVTWIKARPPWSSRAKSVFLLGCQARALSECSCFQRLTDSMLLAFHRRI